MSIEPLSLIVWLVVGGVAGWAAFRIPGGRNLGQRGSLALGVLGACGGGFLMTRFDAVSASLAGDLIAAGFGAILLIVVSGLLSKS